MQSEYNIPWIKGIDYSDCVYLNLLSTCRIYHYNPYYRPQDSIVLSKSGSRFTTKVHVILKTKQGEQFNLFYFLPNAAAKEFKDKFIKDFTHGKGGESG